MRVHRHQPRAPTLAPHVHAPVPVAADVPTVPRGASFPILDDTVLQDEGVPLDRLEVRISEAARRAQLGYSPYAPLPMMGAPPRRTTGRTFWRNRWGMKVPWRLTHGAQAVA